MSAAPFGSARHRRLSRRPSGAAARRKFSSVVQRPVRSGPGQLGLVCQSRSAPSRANLDPPRPVTAQLLAAL